MNLVLSVRNPWAAFIVSQHPAWKPVENRRWPTKVRGWVRIHAAAYRPSKREMEEAYSFALKAGMGNPPRPESLRYGGIIGMVYLSDCVRASRSPWFVGPFGFVFKDRYELPFESCAGQKGFFEYGSINLKHGMSPHP